MNEAICSITECDRGIDIPSRALCRYHYGVEYRAGRIVPRDRSDEHRMTDFDPNTKTALCSICGRIAVRVRYRDGRLMLTCMTRRKQQRGSGGKRSATPAARRAARLRWFYGLSVGDYDAMLTAQGGVCAICGETPDPVLCVDHDHACCPGKTSCGLCVRGLLCFRCNSILGRFDDNVAHLRAAVRYLAG